MLKVSRSGLCYLSLGITHVKQLEYSGEYFEQTSSRAVHADGHLTTDGFINHFSEVLLQRWLLCFAKTLYTTEHQRFQLFTGLNFWAFLPPGKRSSWF